MTVYAVFIYMSVAILHACLFSLVYRIAGKFRGVKNCSTRETVVFVSKNFV